MFYLNTKTATTLFQKTLRRNTYVDKSLLIGHLNKRIGTDNCFVCITRPRRFGKTINANMLGAYYTTGQDNHEIFKNLAIARNPSYNNHLNKHNVIQIDFSKIPDECNSYTDYINYIKNALVSDLEEFLNCHKSPAISISDFLTASSQSFIFIFDEWDFCFNESFMSKHDKKSFLKFLKGLLKDQPYTDLVYMTGVLPVAKYSSGSELNMFNEYNFIYSSVYDNYFGFNEDEVKSLCQNKLYYIKREFASGKGYCDYIFFPKKTGLPAVILELKTGHSASEALAQIKAKNYIKQAEKYKEVILVGINYDKEKHHTCLIEKHYNT